MNEVTLETPELAYLLAALDADAPLGVDAAALFPESEAERDRVYERGLTLLREHQWITPGDEPGRENLSSELMVMIEAMVRARLVFVTERREGRDGARERMVHYLTDYMLIEQVYESGQRYSLAKIADLPTAMLRVVTTVGVPETGPEGPRRVELDEEELAAAVESARAGDTDAALESLGDLDLDAAAVRSLLDAIADPKHRGTVSVMLLDGRRISEARSLAYFVVEGSCWLVTKPRLDAPRVVVASATAPTFWEVFAGYVDELMPPTPAAG